MSLPQRKNCIHDGCEGHVSSIFLSEHHRDLLRFLWWEDGDEKKDVIEYRMKVHLFGATSSPGCANVGLKKAADDGEKEYGADAANFIRENFYVDDGLKSTATASEAINLIESSKAINAKAGLHLHKITKITASSTHRRSLKEHKGDRPDGRPVAH